MGRGILVSGILVALAFSGCEAPLRDRDSFTDVSAGALRDRALEVARKWDSTAALAMVSTTELGKRAVGMQKGQATEFGVDPHPGDGKAPWWAYVFKSSSGNAHIVFLASTGAIISTANQPAFQNTITALGDGWVVDTDEAADAIARHDAAWRADVGRDDVAVSWVLTPAFGGNPKWLASMIGGPNPASFFVDARTGDVEEFAFPVWRSGWFNETLSPTATTLSKKFSLSNDGHPMLLGRIRVDEPGLGGVLNLTFVSADGQQRKQTEVVVPPAHTRNASILIRGPKAGEWTITVKSTAPTLQAFRVGWCAFGMPPERLDPGDACLRAFR